MRNGLQIVDDVYKVLAASDVATAITGKIYKKTLPTGATTENIVINCLAANNEQLEQAIVNVNIHVPNITIHANATQSDQPDHKRFKELSVMVEALLDEYWNNDENFSLHVIQPGILMEDESTGGHYTNIRLEYYFENVNA